MFATETSRPQRKAKSCEHVLHSVKELLDRLTIECDVIRRFAPGHGDPLPKSPGRTDNVLSNPNRPAAGCHRPQRTVRPTRKDESVTKTENREPWWTLYTISWRHTLFISALLALLFAWLWIS